MEVKEFLDSINSIQLDLIKIHEKIIKDFAKNPSKVSRESNLDFMWKCVGEEFNFYETSNVKEMLDEANLFLDSIKEYESYPNYWCSYEVDADSNYDVGSIRYNRIRVQWYEPTELKKFEEYNLHAKKRAKAIVNQTLRPSNYKAPGFREIDCKFMTLWVEGKIDFDTLQQIVYSDCQL